MRKINLDEVRLRNHQARTAKAAPRRSPKQQSRHAVRSNRSGIRAWVKRTKYQIKILGHQSAKTVKRVNKHLNIWVKFGIGFGILGLGLFCVFVYNNNLRVDSYHLTVAEQTLIGQPDKSLMSMFTYDSNSRTYYLDKAGINSNGSTTLSADSVTVGASISKPVFSVKLPANLSQGYTIYDNVDGFSFSLTPKFATSSGKLENGHIVYPLGLNSPKDVYTIKGNGLEEDIIYAKAPKGKIKFSYKLDLPSTLVARMINGGNVGIYSASPYLYGNISYGSAADQAVVAKARLKSTKNYLAFVLPAPQISDEEGLAPASVQNNTKFSLSGNILTFTVSDLGDMHGPISIDPSVVVATASGFSTDGNIENDITYDTTNNQITESGLTGGSVSVWNANSPNAAFPTSGPDMPARSDFGNVEYNGYIYVLGGSAGYGSTSGGDCTVKSTPWDAYFCNGVFYALVCTGSNSGTDGCSSTAGTIGTWYSTTTFATCTSCTMPARTDPGAVAYNGYLYVLGGDGPASGGDCLTTTFLCDGVFSALICTGSNSGTDGCSSTAGTIGSWQQDTAATFPTSSPDMPARAFGATEVYNGYLYEVGGSSDSSVAGGDCISANGYLCNGVFYAPIGSNGQVGAWTATTTFATCTSCTMPARDSFSAAVYNGYLYVLGGKAHSSGGDCLTTNYYCNGVFDAPINSNGSIGSWTATTAFPTSMPARSDQETVVYNGYLYVLGGIGDGMTYDCDYGSDDCAGVWYAPINSNGTIGTWNETNGMATGSMPERADFGTVAYNGYLYVLGGASGAEYADCSATLYVCSGVFYVQINSAGITGNYTTNSNTFTTGELGGQVVAYNGYLYVMGGDAAGTTVNTIYYAAIAANGSVGAFSTTNAFTTARVFFAATAYDGYMYVLGGCSSALASCTTAGNDIATVYSSPIAAAGTTSATWTASTPFTTGRYGLGAFIAPSASGASSDVGYMYIIGGLNGSTTYEKDVQYGEISSTGTITSWTTVGTGDDLNDARAFFGVAYYGNEVYVAGGVGASEYNNVEYAPVSASGGISAAFTVSGNTFTNARQRLGVAADNGYLYISGGYNGSSTYYADTQYAPINSSGAIGAFTTATSFANASYGVGMAAYDGNIYVGGGYNGTTYYNDVYYAPINNSGPGTLSQPTWTTQSALPNDIDLAATAAYNGYVYEVGGWYAAGYGELGVEYATIGAAGTLSAWASTTALTNSYTTCTGTTHAVYDLNAVAYNGYLYALGGECTGSTVSQEPQAIVEYSLICTGSNSGTDGCSSTAGSLGTWNSATSLPNPVFGDSAVAYNGFMYDIGGCDTEYCNPPTIENVNWALICTGSNSGTDGCSSTAGSLGTWTNQASNYLLQETNGATSVVYDGYVYVIGGQSYGSGGSPVFDSVEYALLCNGSNSGTDGCGSTAGPTGTWQYTASLIIPTIFAGTVAYDGYLYELGGANNTTAELAFDEYAPINNNGTLGNWMQTSPLNLKSTQATAVVYNGIIYDIGADNTNGSPNDVVLSNSLNAIPRVGYYTDYIDFTGLSGDDPTPIEMQIYGGDCSSGVCSTDLTNPESGSITDDNGGIYVSYQFASNACTKFNNATTIPTLPNYFGIIKPLIFTTDGCGTTTNIGRYMRVDIILDDSDTASFPDSGGNHSSVTNFTVWYHPAASNHLRGGATFSNGSLQSLDAPP